VKMFALIFTLNWAWYSIFMRALDEWGLSLIVLSVARLLAQVQHRHLLILSCVTSSLQDVQLYPKRQQF